MENPKVSIIIGIFNHSKNFDRLCDSLNNQTDKRFEVLFMDDKSTDGLNKRIEMGNIPEINFPYQYLKPRFKKHLSKMMNWGIRKSIGEYCLFIMGDSFLKEDYIETLIPKLNEDTLVNGIRIQVDNNRPVDIDWRITKGNIPQKEAILINEPFKIMTGNGLTIPRNALLRFGGWDEKIKGYGGDDNLLIGKFYFQGYICKSVPELVVFHNWHKGRISTDENVEYCFKQINKYAYGNN